MTIQITVKSNQKVSKVEKIEKGEYKVFVKSSPIENKANIEVIKVLSKYFDIPKSSIKIKPGLKSSKKIIVLDI